MTTRNVIEKERKFLLKNIPSMIPQESWKITQFYKNGLRYREETDGFTTIHIRLKKTKIAPGISNELDIEEISEEVFFEERNSIPSAELCEISKTRWVYKYNGRKFEVDVFNEIVLVMLEVEDSDLGEEIDFPPLIKAMILMEVTGNPNFDNFNLSLKK